MYIHDRNVIPMPIFVGTLCNCVNLVYIYIYIYCVCGIVLLICICSIARTGCYAGADGPNATILDG